MNDQNFVYDIQSGAVTATGWADTWYDAWLGTTTSINTNPEVPEGKYIRLVHTDTNGVIIIKNSGEYTVSSSNDDGIIANQLMVQFLKI